MTKPGYCKIIKLVNNSMNSNFYLWFYGDGNSDTTFNPTYTFTNNASYNVCLYAANNCERNISCQSVLITGERNIHPVPDYLIYPVPVASELYLMFKEKFKANIDLSICDIFGREVYADSRIFEQNSLINLHFLNPGIYILQLKTENGIVIRKFIKE